LTLAFRTPVLVNASAVNSDMAVVGLQAMHILRGEWHWYLWGTGYQAPIDSLLTAFVFALVGSSPRALGLVPVLGHLVFVACVFAVLKAKFTRWQAFLLTLPAVFTPMAVNYNLIMVQRLACTLMFGVSIWLLDRARLARRPLVHYALGTWCAVVSVYFDLFGLQWLPSLLAFAFLCALDAPRPSRIAVKRCGASAAGALVGFATFLSLRRLGQGSSDQVGLDFKRIPVNFALLREDCLPWALGYRIFFNNGMAETAEWMTPPWFKVWQVSGAIVVALGVVFAAAAFLSKRIPWPVRRLGIFGVLVTASTLGAFVVSVMPNDQWGTRYLAPMILVLPLTLAPAVYRLRTARRAALAIAIYTVSAAVGGWMSYGLDYRRDIWPAPTTVGQAEEEKQLAAFLRQQGILVGAAQYWLAYRLTFLFQEKHLIVPLEPLQDRYPPYRKAFDDAREVAYIAHPSMPWITGPNLAMDLYGRHARYERYLVARYTVFIEHR